MRMLQVASGADPQSSDPCTIGLHGFSRAFAESGHSVHVIYVSETGGPDPGATPYLVEHVPSPSWSRLVHGWLATGISQAVFGLQVAAKLLREDRHAWDAICFHATTPALLGMKVARLRGIPTLLRYQNPLLTQAQGADKGRFDYSALGLPVWAGVCSQIMEFSVLTDATKVAVTSEYARQRITQRFPISPTKVALVPNGVDTEAFKPLPRSSLLMERHGIPDTARVVLCVARISPYKNQMALINAVPAILDEVPDAVFVFVGAEDDPSYLREIRRFVVTNHLEEKVVFTGAVDLSLIPYYHCLADVFVLPSFAEGLPLALLEAMSCGRAIVASSLPQHMEIAEQDDAILLADPGSATAIAKAVTNILQDDSLRLGLQEKARRLAVRAYDWNVVARAMLKACTEAVGHNVRRRD
jgi:glycosyltransferase involved in cell wall biosynthesis